MEFFRANTNKLETNIVNKHKVVKNPNWLQADQLALHRAKPRSWTRGNREQIPGGGGLEYKKGRGARRLA